MLVIPAIGASTTGAGRPIGPMRSAGAGAVVRVTRPLSQNREPAVRRGNSLVDMTEATTTDLRDIPFTTADGGTATLADFGEKVILVVNVASKCGLTPQYEQLEALQREYADRGFTVLGFPCNQFMGQEPGSMDEILEYCSTTWGVSFPIMDKVKVNGGKAAPVYKALKKAEDVEGKRGPILWNFEKFVLTPEGVVHRFRPQTTPDDPAIVKVIEDSLPR